MWLLTEAEAVVHALRTGADLELELEARREARHEFVTFHQSLKITKSIQLKALHHEAKTAMHQIEEACAKRFRYMTLLPLTLHSRLRRSF